ncbi:carboxypeptidase-like regulatory domain-containing protein, partial [Crocinitomicaceae bacterium]|nr:carboxypeptidase-like regulatory domain-containing protein [Crocinitomicaceae bacterium]
MKFVFSFLIVLVLLPVYSQDSETHTLSGYVTDSKSGEALIGAKVFIPEINKGAITNTYGFYSLTVNAGVYLVE